MKVIARKVDTRLMVEIFIDWTFRILLNSFSTDYFLNLRYLLSSFLNKPRPAFFSVASINVIENTNMLTAMKTNYEGNCQESRYEAHGGNT